MTAITYHAHRSEPSAENGFTPSMDIRNRLVEKQERGDPSDEKDRKEERNQATGRKANFDICPIRKAYPSSDEHENHAVHDGLGT